MRSTLRWYPLPHADRSGDYRYEHRSRWATTRLVVVVSAKELNESDSAFVNPDIA